MAVLVAVGLCLFVLVGFTDGHSASYNYPWAAQYTKAFGIDAGLPRHLPGLWAGLGGYDFFFYGPLPFWVIATSVAPFCFGCTPEALIVWGAALFWLLSGATFYFFMRRYVCSRPALVGAVAYCFLPYHLWLDWLARQAFAEFAAYAFIPLIAIGYDRVRSGERGGWILSLGVAATTLCHLPTALLAFHVFGVIAVILFWQKIRAQAQPYKFAVRLTGWAVLGALLSCFYWLPALSLLDTVSADFLYGQHYIAEDWLFGLRLDQPNPQFAWLICLSFLIVAPIVVITAVVSKGTLRTWILAPVILSFLLNLEISQVIWQNWIIAKVQFPWRMMVFVDFAAAVAISAMVMRFNSLRRQRLVLSLLLVLTVLPAAQFGVWAAGEFKDEFKSEFDWVGAQEYLSPEMTTALLGRLDRPEDLADREKIAPVMQQISTDAARLSEAFMTYESRPRHVLITPVKATPRLSVPIQYWFLWQAELEGGIALELLANAELGTIEIIAPEGGFQGLTVTLTLTYHSSEKLGFAISITAFLLLIIAIAKPLWRPEPSGNPRS